MDADILSWIVGLSSSARSGLSQIRLLFPVVALGEEEEVMLEGVVLGDSAKAKLEVVALEDAGEAKL